MVKGLRVEVAERVSEVTVRDGGVNGRVSDGRVGGLVKGARDCQRREGKKERRPGGLEGRGSSEGVVSERRLTLLHNTRATRQEENERGSAARPAHRLMACVREAGTEGGG